MKSKSHRQACAYDVPVARREVGGAAAGGLAPALGADPLSSRYPEMCPPDSLGE
jgi:hypothetical protein